jgi:hypothetical protein
LWRSRTPDGVRCAHFPSVIITILDHKVQLIKPLNLGELYRVAEPREGYKISPPDVSMCRPCLNTAHVCKDDVMLILEVRSQCIRLSLLSSIGHLVILSSKSIIGLERHLTLLPRYLLFLLIKFPFACTNLSFYIRVPLLLFLKDFFMAVLEIIRHIC